MTFPERVSRDDPADPDSGSVTELSPDQLSLLRQSLRVMALRALRDPDAADDAVQETLARAVVALQRGQLADPEKLGAFVRGIAQHVIADTIRAKQRMPEVELTDALPVTAAPSPLDALLHRDERVRLEQAFAQLSESDRLLLRLSYVDGLPSAEVAARLGEPDARIRKRRSRALARLRRALLGEDEPAESQGTARDDIQVMRSST